MGKRGPRVDWYEVGVVCEALRRGTTIGEALKLSSLSETTFHRWMAKGRELANVDPEDCEEGDRDYRLLFTRVTAARGALRELAWDGLLDAVVHERGSARIAAIKLVLDRLSPMPTEPVQVEVTERTGQRLMTSEDVAAMSPTDRGALLASFARGIMGQDQEEGVA